MTRYATPEQHRRIARWTEIGVVLGVLIAVLAVILLYHPGKANAGSYVHLNSCKSSLRGGGGSDDDVHAAGVSSGATSFGGWSSTYTRNSATDLIVKGYLNYPGGYWLLWTGHCWSNDFGPDALS